MRGVEEFWSLNEVLWWKEEEHRGKQTRSTWEDGAAGLVALEIKIQFIGI